jgi:hypothetical protein
MASLTIAPHLKTCGRTRRDVLVALLPPLPKAPGGPNPGHVDPEIYPFDFRRTGFDRWTFTPGCDRSAHGSMSEQGLGLTHHKIPSVSARRGYFPPPSTGGSAVRKGVTLRSRVPDVCTCHHTSRHVRGPSDRFGGIASPRRPPSTHVDM